MGIARETSFSHKHTCIYFNMAPQRAGQKRKVVEVPRPRQQEEDDALGNGLLDGAIDDGSSSDEGASEEESEEEEFDDE